MCMERFLINLKDLIAKSFNPACQILVIAPPKAIPIPGVPMAYTKEWADRIAELPLNGMPVVVMGGSFNSDTHKTRVREDLAKVLDEMLEKGDPGRMFFVIGHRLSGYEKELVERNAGRFRIYAMAPAVISAKEAGKLRESGVGIRIAITAEPMGIYKSIAYEVFKRRPSVLLAFDGNSAGENMIQEGRNSKYPCRIFVNRRARSLQEKASLLKGYVTLFGAEDRVADEILRLSEEGIRKG